MSKLSLRQIEAFRAVVINGSVSKAAERMYVSQPAVSRLIAGILEQSIGFELFDRGKGFHVSEEARLLYQEVEKAFVGLDKIAQRAEDIRTFRTGHLRMAASPALGLGLLPGVTRAFRAKYPDVTVSTQVRASQSVAEWVASGQLDLGYAALPVHQAGVIVLPMKPLPAIAMVPRSHRLASEPLLTPQLLKGEPLISLGAESNLRTQINDVFAQEGVPFLSSLETTMSAHAAMLVQEGLGIALIDPFTALAFKNTELVLKPFSPLAQYEFALLLPEHASQSRPAQAFIKLVDSFLMDCAARIAALYPLAKRRSRQNSTQ